MKVDRQLIFLAASSIIVLVTGTLAFIGHDPEQGWLTALYKAVLLFSMNSGVLDGEPTPPLLEISRWLALGTLVAAVYATVQALLGHLRLTLRIASTKDHAIVCGAGQRGDQLARAFHKMGAGKVVVIEMDENNPSLGELRNLGIYVVVGNALDASVLSTAGISRAKSLVAVTGSDERNLAICSEVKTSLNSRCEVSAGLESWAWRSFLLDRMNSKKNGGPKIRLDSYLGRASRGLMLELVAKPAARESLLLDNGVRILIDADVNRRQELIRAAILTLQISGDRRPVLELTSIRPGEEAAFVDRFPAASLVAELRWHHMSASLAFPEGASDSPDFAVFALDSDIETLEAAQRFWMRHDTPDERVIACLDEGGESSYMDAIQRRKRDFTTVNLLKLGLGTKHPLEPDIEESAQICHAVYFKNEQQKDSTYGSKPGDLPESWSELPERYKESNRLSAMQHEVARNAWNSNKGKTGLEMLVHLSHCEHMRWMAEKAMDGWRWSGSEDRASRDNDKLKHHQLVAYDTLSKSEKDKDFNTFLWALGVDDAELQALGIDEETIRVAMMGRRIAMELGGTRATGSVLVARPA